MLTYVAGPGGFLATATFGVGVCRAFSLGIVAGTKKRAAGVPKHLVGATTLRECFGVFCDLRSLLPKSAIRILAEYAADPVEKGKLSLLCSRQGGCAEVCVLMCLLRCALMC
jgi:hypothetical protein